jgi:tetratricopeptide (TPR) repeat protein
MRHASLASVLRKLGRDEEAQQHLARARELLSGDDHYNWACDDHYNWACIEAIAGNGNKALAHLEQALAQRPGLRAWARRDPDLEALHGHPRFEALVGS